MKIKGSKEIKASVLDRGLCTGCGACISLCPYFATHKGRTAMLFQCSRDSGRCHAYCPRSEVDLDMLSEFIHRSEYTGSPLGEYVKIRASHAGENAGVKKFQTAGTVSALVKFALAKGYIDSAVLTKSDAGYGNPVIITDPEKIPEASGSRYSASPTVKGVNDAIAAGYSKIGVVGTPCQMTAVAQIRSNPLEAGNFIDPIALSIGLFCTWALTPSTFAELLKSKTDISSISKLDIPPPPASVMRVETSNGAFDIPLDEIRAIIPDACSYCHDMTAEFSDISVGVFEGKVRQNIIITRTARGEKLLNEAVNAGYIITEEIPPDSLKPLESASMNKKIKGFSKLALAGLVNNDKGDSVINLKSSTLEKIMKGGGPCC